MDLEGGGKLSGRAGRWTIGTLAIRQDEFRERRADGPVRRPRRGQRVGRVFRRPHRHRWRSALESRQQRRRRRLPLPEHALAEWPHARVRGLVSASSTEGPRGRRRRLGRARLVAEHGQVQGRRRHQGSRSEFQSRIGFHQSPQHPRLHGRARLYVSAVRKQLYGPCTPAPTSSTSRYLDGGLQSEVAQLRVELENQTTDKLTLQATRTRRRVSASPSRSSRASSSRRATIRSIKPEWA